LILKKKVDREEKYVCVFFSCSKVSINRLNMSIDEYLNMWRWWHRNRTKKSF